jgi:pyruvate formate-lyase/glycerol dehydratase family glycyl radical enzyme
MSTRIERLKEEFFQEENSWSLERAALVTEAYMEHRSDVPVLKQAYALAHVLDHKEIWIREGELIVGNYSKGLGTYEMYPEYTFQDVVIRYVHFDFDRELDEHDFKLEQDKRRFKEIREFWRGQCMHEIADTVIPQEIQEMRDTREICGNPYGRDEGQGHIVVSYDQVVARGLRSLIEEAGAKVRSSYGHDAKAYHFNRAVIIVLEAVIRFAHRYAELAECMAQETSDSARAAELLEISRICTRVPEFPADSFWEATQSTWFIHLIMHIEQNGFAISLGRFDQYVYPLFRSDMDQKVITREFAQEILESFFMKCMEITLGGVKISLTQTITICGADADGDDLTNELSYLLIAADRATKMVQPSLIIRWHPNLDTKILDLMMECTWKQDASLAIINDPAYVAGLMRAGIKREDALEFCQAGCNETVIGGKLLGGGVARPIFLIRVLELILNGGVMPDNGKQMGPVVPRLGEYTSWEEFFGAFEKTICHFATYVAAGIGIMDQLHVDLRPLPFASSLMHGAIERGRSLMDELDYFVPVLGHSDFVPVINCLAAIKKCVFEERIVTQKELKSALETNYLGYEQVRYELWNAPKFGNDDEYVDSLISEVEAISRNAMSPFPPSRKSSITTTRWIFEMIPRISHVYEGLLTGATPDGRFANSSLAAGNAAYPGTEKHGPTALLNSMAKLDAEHWCGGVIGQIRVHESFLNTEESRKKTRQMVQTYFQRGGSHLQMNCVTAELLNEAKAHPEEYRDLMVRVGGYVDYFTNLDEASQNDMIRRTEMN